MTLDTKVWVEATGILLLGVVLFAVRPLQRHRRIAAATRGRSLQKRQRTTQAGPDALRWGNDLLPERAATQHFLVVGTTGSGKSLLQRLLMRGALRRITLGRDHRALVYDAKGDTAAYLRRVGVMCPVYSLNPFASPRESSTAVAWDIGKDITSPARSLNLSAALIPSESGDANKYFTDAARLVLDGVVTSFMRHAGDAWTLADLVYATTSRQRIEQVLCRDDVGTEVLTNFLGDDRTGYAVVSTVASKMRYYATVAAGLPP